MVKAIKMDIDSRLMEHHYILVYRAQQQVVWHESKVHLQKYSVTGARLGFMITESQNRDLKGSHGLAQSSDTNLVHRSTDVISRLKTNLDLLNTQEEFTTSFIASNVWSHFLLKMNGDRIETSCRITVANALLA